MEGTDFSGRLLLVSAKSVSQKRVGGVSNDRLIDTWNGEPLKGSYFPFVFWCTWTSRALLCQIIFLKLYFVWALCALLQGDLSCAALTLPQGGERQQMGLGQRADVSDSKRPGCWVEAASIRKLLFPWEPTNHWRKLKMSPLRNAIKSSKKLQLCRWCAAVCLFGC